MKSKPRLKTIQAKAYRNLEMATPFELDNLNILIGANGAGKSNLLEMIEFLPEALSKGLAETLSNRRGFTSVIDLNRELPSEMQLVWELTGSPHLTQGIELKYHLIIKGESHGRFSVTQEILEEAKPRTPNEITAYKHLDFKYGEGAAMPSNGLQRVSENLKSAQNMIRNVLFIVEGQTEGLANVFGKGIHNILQNEFDFMRQQSIRHHTLRKNGKYIINFSVSYNQQKEVKTQEK